MRRVAEKAAFQSRPDLSGRLFVCVCVIGLFADLGVVVGDAVAADTLHDIAEVFDLGDQRVDVRFHDFEVRM